MKSIFTGLRKHVLLLLASLATGTALAQHPTNGLVERFTFDNTLVGTNGTTLAGTADYVNDRDGAANSAQNVADQNTLSATSASTLPQGNTARTVAFWYKSNASNSNVIHSLFNYSTGTNSFSIAYVAGNLVFSNSATDATHVHAWSSNWVHVAVSHTPPYTIIRQKPNPNINVPGSTKLYVNGAFVKDVANMTFANNNSVIRIGASPGGDLYNNFAIDDLLIYNRELAASEVTCLALTHPVNTTPVGTFPHYQADLTACLNSTATLSASGNGTLNWYNVATEGTALGTGTTFTTPSLTVKTTFYVASEGPGCTSARTPIIVDLRDPNMIPISDETPVANKIICAGSTTTLTAFHISGGLTWHASANDAVVLESGEAFTTPVLTANTTYYLQHNITALPGCSSDRLAIPVTVKALPTVNVSGTNTLTVDQVNATYQWLDCENSNAAIDGETSQTFTPVKTGSYAVTVTKDGCEATASCTNVVLIPTALNDDTYSEQIEIYPNPASDKLLVSNLPEGSKVLLINQNGQVVYTTTANQTDLSIDVSGLSDGLYVIRADANGKHVSKKILVQK